MTVLKRKLCSDTVGNKRFWKLAGDLEAGPPTRAMLRYYYRSIYKTRVAAACQHHKTFVLHVQDHCLIIMNPRVWLPLAVNPSDLGRAPFFIGRRARNLSGDQDMSAD